MRYLLLPILFLTTSVFCQVPKELQHSVDSLNNVIDASGTTPLGKGDAYNALGYVYKNYRYYDEALDAFDEALKIFKKEKHHQAQAWTWTYISYVYADQLLSEKAIEALNKSNEICIENKLIKDAAPNYLQLGYSYINTFDYRKSKECFLKAQKLYKQLEDDVGLQYTYRGLGYMYISKSDHPNCMAMYKEAKYLAERLRDDQLIASILVDISGLYFEMASYDRGIEIAKEAEEVSTRINYDIGITQSWMCMSICLKQKKEYDLALEYLEKIQKKYDEMNYHIADGIVYNNMATIYFERRILDEAIKYHLLGLEYNDEANDRPGTLRSMTNVGMTYFKMGEVKKALDYGHKAEKEMEALGDLRLYRYNSLLLFEIYDFQKKYDLAENYITDLMGLNEKSIIMSFPAMSETEKEAFFQVLRDNYMEFYSFSLEHKERNPQITGLVYNQLLRNKGALLKSSTAMRNAILSSGDGLLIDKYERWLVLKKQIAEYYSAGKETKDLEQSANNIEKELVKKAQIFSDVKNLQTIKWTDVRDKLTDEEAAIEFIHFNQFDEIGDRQDSIVYCALVVRKNSTAPEMIRLCTEKELADIMGKFGGNNAEYINRIYGTSDQLNTKLYDKIWKPLLPHLDGAKTIHLSPSGLLHRVAFAALAPEKNVLLCDEYQLMPISSTARIVYPDHFKFDEDMSMTLFGGIDYDTPNSKKTIWSYLSGTKKEVENIETIVSSDQHTIYKGTTEKEFKEYAPKSGIIHLSTHGFFYPDPEEVDLALVDDSENNEEEIEFRGGTNVAVESFVMNKNPLMRSGLALSGANGVWGNPAVVGKEDGVLTAFEVAQLDLRKTGLVVLSACETGLGDIKGSEGVYGLQRAFKMAGVNHIIMSLWQVPDKETQEFMTTFYRKLVDVREAEKAFYDTQHEMRQKYDPYYWAAFVLVE